MLWLKKITPIKHSGFQKVPSNGKYPRKNNLSQKMVTIKHKKQNTWNNSE